MAPTYKLTYFDGYWAAEPIRIILSYANQEFEDVRIKHADWPSIKPTTPFGKVPVLEVDGKQIAQSSAISRYLAKQFGLAGKNEWESLQCDILVDTLKDLLQGVSNFFMEKDTKKKADLKKQFLEQDVPFYLGKFNKVVADNPDGYLVGSQITWADITFFTNLETLESAKPGVLKAYPALEALLKKVSTIPSIKAWIDKRPEDTFKLEL